MTDTAQCQVRNPSISVVEQVADERGVAYSDLAPLYETIDPDALDDLVDSKTDDSREPIRVSFQYEGCRVVVQNDGQISVSPRDDRP